MKYQIYLNKETSELVNAISKLQGKKPNSFIKEFIENCFETTEKVFNEEQLDQVRDYGRKEDK